MVLGLTDTLKANLQSYMDWMRKSVADVEIVPLSCVSQNLSDLDRCDGLVLTGGGDIHPKFYGREDAMLLVRDVNERRDEFEFAVIKHALDLTLPILGICRGMQVFNVAQGGTLIPDVQSAGFQNHRREQGATGESRHGVHIEQNTNLHSITRSLTGNVNTSHHQAVDTLGRGLQVTARSTDGVVEGLEWDSPTGRSFLQLVQWHPERMEDFDNPLSGGLIVKFVNEVMLQRTLS